MREHERLIVGGVVSLILILTPGFLLHSDPRFAGSLLGSVLGIVAAILMLLTLIYPLFKRASALRGLVSMRWVLQLHVFAGVLGPLLAMLHSGHKFDSAIGISMIVLILMLVTSGFVGRYYLGQLSGDLREDKASLEKLQVSLAGLREPATPEEVSKAIDLAGAISDVEQAVGAQEALRRAFGKWMVLHIASTFAFVLLLGLHVWSAVYFGLRWLR